MDFLPKTANLQGGDTRKTPNLANHGIRQEGKTPPPRQPLPIHQITEYHAKPTDGKTPPYALPSIPPNHGISRQSLSILSNQNTLRVDTWIRDFRCGASDFCFSFKNAARATVPWQWPLPQRSVFFAT